MDNTEIVAKALFSMIQEQYGERLAPEQLAEVRQAIEANAQLAKTLASFKLSHADEPFSVFTPYRAWEI